LETDEKESSSLLDLFAAKPESDEGLELGGEEASQEPAENEVTLEATADGEAELETDLGEEGEGEEPELGDRAKQRIERLVGERNKLKGEVVPELQSRLLDATKSIGELRGELAAVEAKTPDWFEKIYGDFADPEGTAKFDAALCGVLDEKEFREDPTVKKVIDRAIAELKKRGFKVTQNANQPGKKAEEVVTPVPVAEDWTARSIVDSSVKDVLKRAGVRPELVSVLTEAVAPALLKESAKAKSMPTDKAIVDAVSAHVKALGWKPDFYRAPKEDPKQESRPGTSGSRSAVVTPKKADPKKDAKVEEPKAPTTAGEADDQRRGRLRKLFDALPADQRGANA
jgi:phage gp16-like protein